ncbi:hypothetical protein TNCV_26341 [Trichonephila clavipes]|nr:hypothetical protein TNCV_26341 [Trichonephila clavipes]
MELHKLCANHEKLSPDPEQNYNFATLTETKTDVLSTVAKIFDPVGLMAPVISKSKDFPPAFVEKQIEWNNLCQLKNIENGNNS